MLWESALGSVIEVAIAIAGFSGIVAAVGHRGAGRWTAADQLRLRILLTASGVAIVFAFLPFVLVDLLDPSIAWRLASGLLAIHTAAITAHRVRQASHANASEAIGLRVWWLVVVAAVVGMLVGNAVWFASPALYVLGVLWGVFVAFMTFATLLLDAWRQPREASPPS